MKRLIAGYVFPSSQVQIIQEVEKIAFLGATKHIYNWLCPLVGLTVGQLVGRSVGR